jgi:bifunctional UDP-N-acetylglucosamine pyrophosphorylase/glucosamine-1-phosphate N-acetyltransferase
MTADEPKALPPLACIILAAGLGKRMKSDLPKVLHPLAGRPMVQWLLESVQALQPERIVVVTAPGMDAVREAVAPARVAIQEVALGTGDAVKAALPELEGFHGDVLILLGDMPLIQPETLIALRARRHRDSLTGLTVLGIELDPPPAFGRLVLDGMGGLEKIVEDRDCTPLQRQIRLCNTGAFCVDGERLAGWVAQIGQDNAQGEFYITDLPQIAAEDGFRSHVHVVKDADEVRGVNSRADLAALEAIVQDRLRAAAMAGGATMHDPSTVYLSHNTKLGRDVTVEPNVWFGPGVTVGDRCVIHAFSHLQHATVGAGCSIGPFARLRPGTEIGPKSRIGNFVEIKNAMLGEGVKASHLAYIGDADVGAGTNFSCGAITVNYDGVDKHRTTIGANAMIGSNVNLVAPVTIGTGAYVAAGTTVTKNVQADALAVGRIKPNIIEGWAAKKRK